MDPEHSRPLSSKFLSFSARWPYKAVWPTRLRLRGFSTLLTVATGRLKIDHAPAVYLTNALFFVGAERPMLDQNRSARATNITGEQIVKKTLIENQMGLTDAIPGMNSSLHLSIGTTAGQGGHLRILDNPWFWCIFIALAVFDVVGLVISILMMIFAVGGHGTAAPFIVPVAG